MKFKLYGIKNFPNMNKKFFTNNSETILSFLGVPNHSFTLSLISPTRIQRLNKKYRFIDKPTDILSFRTPSTLANKLCKESTPQNIKFNNNKIKYDLGDLYMAPLCFPEKIGLTEKGLSKGINCSKGLPSMFASGVEEYTRVLLVHGVCHLLGWDHKESRERVEMEGVERKVYRRCLEVNGGVRLFPGVLI